MHITATALHPALAATAHQHCPESRHDCPDRQLHVAPLADCSVTMVWPDVVVYVATGVTGAPVE